jgi:hypothetical protein
MQNEPIIKTDKFTRFLLSVIAIALVAIVIKLYFTPERAIATPSVMDVNIKSIDGRSISGGMISVNLEQMNGRNISNSLPVNLNSINNLNIPANGIPVDIKCVAGNSQYNGTLSVKIVK